MGVISLGLAEIQVGAIAADGGEASTYSKIGKTYEKTCKLTQDKADVTEHYEEGQSAPKYVRRKRKCLFLLSQSWTPTNIFKGIFGWYNNRYSR